HVALERAAARPAPGYLRAIPVEQVMECEVSSLEPGASSVRDAAEAMVETGRGCVPVVEPVPGGLRLVGIVTESDLIRLAFQNGRARPAPPAGRS
ncbi:MAG: CBS domain-containing protein, partial [Myxococcota bacterium]|nr:CBS domain-containing protein [Myxococcota bacterium]